ncbi:hypothetical protein ACEQ8H_006355 [Pleosporales sp. CAS-2024a]
MEISQAPKAAGSNEGGCLHGRRGSSASQSRGAYKPSQKSPYNEHGVMYAPSSGINPQSEALSRRYRSSSPALAYSRRRVSHELSNKTSSSIHEEWDVVEHEDKESGASPESYHFPDTWPAALQDTTNALAHIRTATASYATALTASGIGKAGWSVGSALASTANRRALSLVNWAADRTGTGTDALPRAVAEWLKGGRRSKDEHQRAERKAMENKEPTRVRGEPSPHVAHADQSFEEALFEDEQSFFTLEMSEVEHAGGGGDAAPANRYQDGFDAAPTVWGGMVQGRGRWTHGDYEKEEEEEDDDDDDKDKMMEPRGDGLVRLFQFDDEA